MVAFSLGKVLFLVFIVVAVWYGVKFFARIGEVRQAIRRAAAQAEAQAARMQQQQARPAIPTENLVRCRACGAFVPAQSATACGRSDCPWGR